MDYTPMLYLKTPGEAMASVSTLKIILFLITIITYSLHSLSISIINSLTDYSANFERIQLLAARDSVFHDSLGSTYNTDQRRIWSSSD